MAGALPIASGSKARSLVIYGFRVLALLAERGRPRRALRGSRRCRFPHHAADRRGAPATGVHRSRNAGRRRRAGRLGGRGVATLSVGYGLARRHAGQRLPGEGRPQPRHGFSGTFTSLPRLDWASPRPARRPWRARSPRRCSTGGSACRSATRGGSVGRSLRRRDGRVRGPQRFPGGPKPRWRAKGRAAGPRCAASESRSGTYEGPAHRGVFSFPARPCARSAARGRCAGAATRSRRRTPARPRR